VRRVYIGGKGDREGGGGKENKMEVDGGRGREVVEENVPLEKARMYLREHLILWKRRASVNLRRKVVFKLEGKEGEEETRRKKERICRGAVGRGVEGGTRA